MGVSAHTTNDEKESALLIRARIRKPHNVFDEG